MRLPSSDRSAARVAASSLAWTLAVGLAACAATPARGGLRYSARAAEGWTATGWTPEGAARFATAMLGTTVVVELHPHHPRLDIAIENPTTQAIEVRLGPEATRKSDAAIGEFQPRRLDYSRVEGAGDFAPYLSMQPVQVEAGFRTLFALDSPLGREPSIGQYFVLVVEMRAGGRSERRLLPLQATNAGT